MRAVIYARYSSHNQREESIEGQLRRCHDYAEQNGFTVVGEYIDRAISGKTDRRDSFQKMIRDSEKGTFEAVIMYTLDRFARNRYDSAHYKAKLKKNGVRLYYTEQSISDSPEGIILESVLEGMAEYYSENLSRGVRRGMQENALKCMVNGGPMLLGYRKTSDNRYEIDPATAPIVREIFDLYTIGKTQRQIADILNEKGCRTSKGKRFTVGSLERILKNKKYIGIYTFDNVEVLNGMPAIVGKEVFEKAQEIMKKNKRQSGRMKAPVLYLLTGKIFCGECGSAMRGDSGTSHTGKIYNYYKCSDRKTSGTCAKSPENKEVIETLVVERTIEKIMEPGVIEKIATVTADYALKEFNDESCLIALKDELSGIQKSINNLLRLVEKGADSDDLTDRLMDLSGKKADLQKRIAAEEHKMPPISKEHLSFWLTDLVTHYDGSPEYRQKIIDTLVNKVFVFDGTDGGGRRIVVICNTSDKIKVTVDLGDIPTDGSEIDSFSPPLPTIPNLFFVKNGFGIIIPIESVR